MPAPSGLVSSSRSPRPQGGFAQQARRVAQAAENQAERGLGRCDAAHADQGAAVGRTERPTRRPALRPSPPASSRPVARRRWQGQSMAVRPSRAGPTGRVPRRSGQTRTVVEADAQVGDALHQGPADRRREHGGMIRVVKADPGVGRGHERRSGKHGRRCMARLWGDACGRVDRTMPP